MIANCQVGKLHPVPQALLEVWPIEAACGVGYYNIHMNGKMASQSVSAGSFIFESVGDSFAWLGVGRLTVDSKYWRRFILISTSRLPVYAGKVRDRDRERI